MPMQLLLLSLVAWHFVVFFILKYVNDNNIKNCDRQIFYKYKSSLFLVALAQAVAHRSTKVLRTAAESLVELLQLNRTLPRWTQSQTSGDRK